MQIIDPYTEILYITDNILERIELIGRNCYKSEDKIFPGSAENFVKKIIDRKHLGLLEHVHATVRFVCDRGVSHELVRHRLASYAQESTRYCNYNETGLTFISPVGGINRETFHNQMLDIETQYYKSSAPPQVKRYMLPMCLKTDVIMTANMRTWRDFFEKRALNVTGKCHPEMLRLTISLLRKFKETIPIIFDDLI